MRLPVPVREMALDMLRVTAFRPGTRYRLRATRTVRYLSRQYRTPRRLKEARAGEPYESAYLRDRVGVPDAFGAMLEAWLHWSSSPTHPSPVRSAIEAQRL